MNSNQWCTIQSDPAVFTELISKLGVPAVQVEEIYSLEDVHQLEALKPIYGLIFLFKWVKDPVPRETLEIYDDELFFARQIVNNACATQAIVSLLLNTPLKVEGAIKEFYDFSKDLTAEDKGLALGNSQSIRKIHNDFKQPEVIVHHDKKKPKKQADAFHFVTYVPFKGAVYELDGLRKGPIKLGNHNGYDEWLSVAQKAIEERIHLYEGTQIRFTLLAVCESLKNKADSKLTSVRKQQLSLLLKLQASGYQGNKLDDLAALKEKYGDVPDSKEGTLTEEQLLNELSKVQGEIGLCEMQLHEEQQKANNQKRQNARRKHNYIPLIVEMLKIAAKKGKIQQFLSKDKKKA